MVRGRGYLWPVLFHLAIRADPDGGADNALNDFAIHFLLPECPVIGHYFFFRIAQKREGEVVLLDKFLVGGLHVRGNTQNNDIQFQEFAVQVTESLGFFGSAGCVVFGIEVEDDVFPAEVL